MGYHTMGGAPTMNLGLMSNAILLSQADKGRSHYVIY